MPKKTLRWMLLYALLMILFAAGTSFGNRLRLFGVLPDVLPALVCAVAVCAGRAGGAWFGFAAGLLSDVYSPAPIGFYFALYFFAGAVIASLTDTVLRPGYPTALFCTVLLHLSGAALDTLLRRLYPAAMPAGEIFRVATAGTLYSALLSAPVWAAVRAIVRLTRTPEDTRRAPRRIRGLSPEVDGV